MSRPRLPPGRYECPVFSLEPEWAMSPVRNSSVPFFCDTTPAPAHARQVRRIGVISRKTRGPRFADPVLRLRLHSLGPGAPVPCRRWTCHIGPRPCRGQANRRCMPMTDPTPDAVERHRMKIQRQLDEALADSFPASDPVSIVTSQEEEDWGGEAGEPPTAQTAPESTPPDSRS